jgi:electron transfer DM13
VRVDTLLAWIYPNRVLVAVGCMLLLAVVVVVGWRLGWHHVARRHLRLSMTAVVVALGVALPMGWYLGSPLIIRTELVEAAPTLTASTSSPTPTTAASAQATARATASPTPAPTPKVASGQFKGADEFHFARGSATLIETRPDRFTLRLENFSVRNGPDLYVYLSRDPKGYAAGAVELGRLKATDGAFNYSVPVGSPVDAVRSVVIWCKAFSVQFGVAELSR